MADGAKLPRSCEWQAHRHTNRSGTTTPEQQGLLPPSPPVTDERRRRTNGASTEGDVVGMLQRTAEQSSVPSFVQTPIDQSQYKQHKKQIERLFRRHDYDPDNGLLVIRLPSTIHEYFLSRFVDVLKDQLRTIASSASEAGNFASEIESIGSARIFLKEDNRGSEALRRQPDAQFQHSNATYPGVVVEGSYSQDGKSLRKLAQDYILGSNGDIKAVIGIDINPQGKASTISLWRPRYTESDDEYILEAIQEISYMPFRTGDGSPTNQQEQLILHLSDFATDEIPSGCDATPLSIDLNSLHQFLSQAERRQHIRESGAGVKSRRPTMKRRLSSSSAEELRSGGRS